MCLKSGRRQKKRKKKIKDEYSKSTSKLSVAF